MSNKNTCNTCNGTGSVDALVSQHDDKKETIICPHCKGAKFINQMTDSDEQDYHADYW